MKYILGEAGNERCHATQSNVTNAVANERILKFQELDATGLHFLLNSQSETNLEQFLRSLLASRGLGILVASVLELHHLEHMALKTIVCGRQPVEWTR